MSDFACPVIALPPLQPHGNADSLSVVEVEGSPVVVRTEEYRAGEACVYFPVESVIPAGTPGLEFLDPDKTGTGIRVKARRLRGRFSMGLLCPVRALTSLPAEAAVIGRDVASVLGVTKYEEPEPVGGEDAPAPAVPVPVYTDIESWRRWKHVLEPGEPVVITEKVHGCNARFGVFDGAPACGSHSRWKEVGGNSLWAMALRQPHGPVEEVAADTVAERLQAMDRARKGITGLHHQPTLEDRLRRLPGLAVYGEVYGYVQDLRYGMGPGQLGFRAFDALDPTTGKYLNVDDFRRAMAGVGIDTVPILYSGPYNPDIIEELAEGQSQLGPCIREGIVIRPQEERWDPGLGRVIEKLHGQGYLLRRGGSERH